MLNETKSGSQSSASSTDDDGIKSMIYDGVFFEESILNVEKNYLRIFSNMLIGDDSKVVSDAINEISLGVED